MHLLKIFEPKKPFSNMEASITVGLETWPFIRMKCLNLVKVVFPILPLLPLDPPTHGTFMGKVFWKLITNSNFLNFVALVNEFKTIQCLWKNECKLSKENP